MGVSFEIGVTVFDDPLSTSFEDPHPDGDRLITIGGPSKGRPVVLYVVHTDPVPLNGSAVGAHHIRKAGDRS